MSLTISQFIDTEVGIILISSILATLIPSPTDWIHFTLQNYMYSHRLKRLQFELLQIFDWYILDSSYYVLIFIVAFILAINNVSTINTIYIVLTLLSLGAVIGIIGKFVMSKRRYRKR